MAKDIRGKIGKLERRAVKERITHQAAATTLQKATDKFGPLHDTEPGHAEAAQAYAVARERAVVASDKLYQTNQEINRLQDQLNAKTVDWQKTLVGVSLVYGKIRGIFGQITSAAKQTLLVNERIAGMQHIVLGATEKITQAWLMVVRVMAQAYSVIEKIPSEIIAGAFAAGVLLAIWKSIAIVVGLITWPYVLIGALVAGAIALWFWLSEARKESDAIKGTWIDITNIWKSAMQQGILQPQGQRQKSIWSYFEESGVGKYMTGMGERYRTPLRDPRREPLPDNDDGL